MEWCPHEITAEPREVRVFDFYERGKERLHLKLLSGEKGLSRKIPEPLAHRPGLALAGFFENYAHNRIQVIGLAEYTFLESMKEKERIQRIRRIFEQGIPCMILARGKPAFPEMLEFSARDDIPLFQTDLVTMAFIHNVTFVLEALQAPSRKVHGTMLEVDGVGVLIEGDAGIGKSETALGLIMKGHALVADDLTKLTRNADGDVIASAAEVTMNFMEIRGLGFIHVPSIFGVAAMRGEKKVDLVVTLLQGRGLDDLDRTGMDERYRSVLGLKIPQRIIAVAPGRDLVNLVETAARQHKHKMSGISAVEMLDEQIKRYHISKGVSKNGR